MQLSASESVAFLTPDYRGSARSIPWISWGQNTIRSDARQRCKASYGSFDAQCELGARSPRDRILDRRDVHRPGYGRNYLQAMSHLLQFTTDRIRHRVRDLK